MTETMSAEKPIVLEWLISADKWRDTAENAVVYGLKPISGLAAFRRYDLWTGPIKNVSGNLRGMVINPTARQIYQVAEKSGTILEKVAVLSILAEAASEYSRIMGVAHSQASTVEKSSRIMFLGSAAILRAVTSPVPTFFHYAAVSAGGYGMLYSTLTGSASGNLFAEKAAAADAFVTETHTRQWDGAVWYDVVTAHLN